MLNKNQMEDVEERFLEIFQRKLKEYFETKNSENLIISEEFQVIDYNNTGIKLSFNIENGL